MPLEPPPFPSAPPAAVAAPSALLKQVLEAAAQPMALCDPDGGLRWANGRFVSRVGVSLADLAGRELLACVVDTAAADADTLAGLRADLERGAGFDDCELPARRVDGQRRTVRLRAEPLAADAPHEAGFLVVLQDVDPMQRLQAAHDRLATLLDLAQEVGRLGIWERELPSGEGVWDRHMFRLYGLDPASATPPYDVAARQVHPEDARHSQFWTAARTAGRYAQRFRVRHPDGSVRHLHSVWRVFDGPGGRPDRALGISMDDSESWELAQSFHEASAQLRMAVTLGNIGVWRHDFRTRRLQLNDVAWSLLGVTRRPEGLAEDEARALVHPDDVAGLVSAGRAALAQDGPTDVHARLRREDGAWRDMLTRRVVERDADGRPSGFIGVMLDLSEQIRSSRRSLELARRLELAAEAAGIGVWSFRGEDRHSEWNGQMWTLLGLEPAPLPPSLRRWTTQRVHPDDRDRLMTEAIAWLRDGGTALDQEFRVVHRDGQVRWLASRARVEDAPQGRLTVGVMLDITAQRAVQQALRDAYERATLTARGAGIATWERGLDEDSASWDDQMYRLRGLDPRTGPLSVAQRHAHVHPEDLPRIRLMQTHAVEHGQPVSYEFRVRLPDGRWRWLASRAMPVSDEAGRVQRLIGVNWDATDARTAEAQRREKEIALRESQAKSQFLARMSHELRTPLNAVLGFTQLLQVDEDGSSPVRAARLAHIRSGGEHLLTLIDEVLDLSSLESGQLKLDLQPVPVGEVLREALPLVQQLARRHGVIVEAGTVEGVAMADRTRLRQVLINLLSNAIKYNRPRGRVTVRGAVQGSRLALHVSDTGRGMSPEQLGHLFEPFNRLGIEREGIEGTGIGLVIVKMLVERMGGQIAVRSETGVGSVFELRLRSPEAPTTDVAGLTAPMGLEPTPPPAARLRNGTLLYIEDNPVNTLLVQELVAQRPGLRLVCAEDGRQGIEQAIALQPDLVLVDMQLPDMDGHEVLRRLRQQAATAAIPCIALSANAMTDDIERALAAGFSDYWTKPIDLNGFMSSLDALFVGDKAGA